VQPATADPSQSIERFMDTPPPAPARGIGRVAIVSDSLPERNGVGAYYRDLVDQLDDQGYRTEFICPKGERGEYLKFPLPGDATQRIWIPSPRRFRDAMRGLQPQTVVVATPGPYGLLGAWWARRIGARLIIGFHTHFSGVTDLYSNPFLRTFSRFWFSNADKILFRYGELVLANSESMVDLAYRLGAKKVEVIGTLVPLASLNEPVTPLNDRLERVLFAGRLAPEKNVHHVIEAAQAIPEIQFTIAGDGPLRSDVQAQAANTANLEYLGWVSRDELRVQMDRADMLVLPSTLESFGTVALEMMVRERLALVSNNCGIVDWPGLADCLYRIGETQTVTDAVREIAALPPGARRELAVGAREAARKLNHSSLLHWLHKLQPVEAAEAVRGS
jgi:glycosyltransferase involved in cell wall biosynthesis